MILVLSVLHVWDRDVHQLAEGETWGPMNALDHLASRIKAKVFPLSVSLIHAPLSCRMETSDPEDALHSPFCIYFISVERVGPKDREQKPRFCCFCAILLFTEKGVWGVCVRVRACTHKLENTAVVHCFLPPFQSHNRMDPCNVTFLLGLQEGRCMIIWGPSCRR